MTWQITPEMIEAGTRAHEECLTNESLIGDPELAVMTIYNAMRRLEGMAPRLRRVVRSGLFAPADDVIGGTNHAGSARHRAREGSS